MNITEKILARASDKKEVSPGEIVEARVDMTLTHEKLGPVFFPHFRELGVPLWDREKVVVFVDHGTPPSKPFDAELIQETVRFARDYQAKYFYHSIGICHQVMAEKGHVRPGEVLLGTDSHTVTGGAFGAFASGIGSTEMAWVYTKGTLWLRVPETLKFHIRGKLPPLVAAKDVLLRIAAEVGMDGATYKAMEFAGPVVEEMSIADRMVLCNMSVELGAKNGIVNPDEKVFTYLKDRTSIPYKPLVSDARASYAKIYTIDADTLEPLVALPGRVDDVRPVKEVEGTKIDKAFLGTCTSGRLEDLRAAAAILDGHRVHPEVIFQVIPASQEVFNAALDEGLVKKLSQAGAIWCNSSCGPCGGGHQGVLAKEEVLISTQNRNSPGRSGHVTSKVFLASSETVAASALRGAITDPRRF